MKKEPSINKSPVHRIPYDEKLKEKARKLRNNSTPAEKKFWNVLRTTSFYKRYPFTRQKPLGNFIVDFYCHSLGLVVEIDGNTHGEDDAKKYDQKRTVWLEKHGLQVIRFSNREVLNSISGVMKTIESVIEK